MSIQIEKYETGASAASSDLQIVSTIMAVNHKLINNEDNVKDVYVKFRTTYQDRIIQPIVQEVVKASTAKIASKLEYC